MWDSLYYVLEEQNILYDSLMTTIGVCGWCKLVSKTTDKNKDVTKLEPWSGTYKEFGPPNKFFSPSLKLEKITLKILEFQDNKTSTYNNCTE